MSGERPAVICPGCGLPFPYGGVHACTAVPPYGVRMEANKKQVGGEHYKNAGEHGLQHWDVVFIFDLDYFQGNITKYLFRWRKKGGIQDLEKARHYLEKYIELAKAELK